MKTKFILMYNGFKNDKQLANVYLFERYFDNANLQQRIKALKFIYQEDFEYQVFKPLSNKD